MPPAPWYCQFPFSQAGSALASPSGTGTGPVSSSTLPLPPITSLLGTVADGSLGPPTPATKATPLMISSTFPPIPAKAVEKIRSGAYIDLKEFRRLGPEAAGGGLTRAVPLGDTHAWGSTKTEGSTGPPYLDILLPVVYGSQGGVPAGCHCAWLINRGCPRPLLRSMPGLRPQYGRMSSVLN